VSYIQSNQESHCLAVNWRAPEQLSNPNWLLIMCRRLHLHRLRWRHKPTINTKFSVAYSGDSWWRPSCTGGAARAVMARNWGALDEFNSGNGDRKT
jgi:hypothetical protein